MVKTATWERYVAPEERGYLLGQRNPTTLPNGSHERETDAQNRAGTRHWRRARVWANRVGGKY